MHPNGILDSLKNVVTDHTTILSDFLCGISVPNEHCN